MPLPVDRTSSLVARRDTAVVPQLARADAPAPPAGAQGPFGRVVVHRTLAAAEASWRHLEAVAPASPYQTLAWTRAWMETEGVAQGVRPVVAVACDRAGAAIALLALGHSRHGLLGVIGFLGGRHANYGLGLFDPAQAWTAADLARLLRAVAVEVGGTDVIELVNQPLTWAGWRNPLALLPHQSSSSQGHRAVLEADGEAFLRHHLSGSARKKLRSKATQLGALGPVVHVVARSPAEIEAVLDAHCAQKAAKLAQMGASPGTASLALTRRVYARAALAPEGGAAPLQLHALRCGPHIVATFGGLPHAGHYAGLLISYDGDPAIARCSPGEILLAAVVRGLCAAGVASFDLGIGEARYKDGFCPIEEPLIDTLLATSPLGRVFVAGERLRLRLKRMVKQSAWAWPLARAIRRRLPGRH